MKKLFLILLSILFLPNVALSEQRNIYIEWEHQYDENVAGYRLYLADTPVCETTNLNSMDCTIDAPDGEATFTLTCMFQDGTESEHSEPFIYIFSSDLNATIEVDTISGPSPLTIVFDGTASTGNISIYDWSFGDGQVYRGSLTSHTFTTPGNYTVTLSVVDNIGATDRETTTITVSDPATVPNTGPTARISSSSTVGNAPLSVQFNGTASSDSDGFIASYEWDMGNGDTSSGPEISYTYSTPGTYHPTLKVTDDGGLSDTVSTPVIVNQPSDGTNLPPVPSITTSATNGYTPLNISFDAGSSSDPDGSIKTYTWNFGDGTIESGELVSHTFTQPATYTVSLTVTDDMEASTQATYNITAIEAPSEPLLAIEIGKISVNSNWTRVNLEELFIDPVIVATPLTYNDIDPAGIRIKNIDPTGFDIQIQEWDYLDGSHPDETVSYLAMESGHFTLDDGTKIEAGTFKAKHSNTKVKFTEKFKSKPVVLTTVSSENEPEAVSGQIKNLGKKYFKYKLKEQEANRGKDKKHALEKISYIAWEPGSGLLAPLKYEAGHTKRIVTDQWYQIDFQTEFQEIPFFFSSIQRYRSKEPSNLRYKNLTQTYVQVKIEEETSKDTETKHGKESIGYIIFEQSQ